MKDLQTKFTLLTTLLKRYTVLIVIIIFGAMYGFLIITSSKQVENQPSDAQITEKLQANTRPKIDKNVAEKLTELQEQNIEVKTIFEAARNNPFSE